MSDLQPEGALLVFNGEERRLVWDYGVIEKVQEKYGGHPFLAIEAIYWTGENGWRHFQAKPLLDLLWLLLNNEVARQKYFEGSSTLKTYKREELGYLVDRGNAAEVANAIVNSWVGSNAEADPEDDEKKTG